MKKAKHWEFHLATCQEHRVSMDFVKSYKMPKHWRDEKLFCQKNNCYRNATEWVILDLADVMPDVIDAGQSRLVEIAR